MANATTVLIGSYPSIPATTLTVTANAVATGLSWTSASLYLSHPTGALSILTTLAALIDTHAQLVGTSCVVTRSRRVLITNATAFALTWGSDTTLRDLLGFTANLASATSHLATNVSPLLWAPGKNEHTIAGRQDTSGIPVHDTFAGRSAPGLVVATRNNTWHRNTLGWRYVHVDRVEQTTATNGTWAVWWDTVASRFRRFWVCRDVTEDSADTTTAMTLSTKLPSSGAYIMKADGPIERAYTRAVDRLELFGDVEIEVETALEYGA
jgi:hypothetical protein